MAPIGSSMATESKKPLDISNLMSPPEPPQLDSFSQSGTANSMGHTVSDMRRVPGPVVPPLSPPISPATTTDDHALSVASSSVIPMRDPILYPAQGIEYSPAQQPLFVWDESVEAQAVVDHHVVARPAELFQEATPPKREEYELVLHFRSEVMKKFSENPKSWLQRERAQLLADRRAGASRNKLSKLQPILPAKPQQIRKEAQRPRPTKAPMVTKQAKAKPTGPRAIRSRPPQATASREPAKRKASETPDPSSRRAAATTRADEDFNALHDFCPPTDSLPNKPNSLKVVWKGQPVDLDKDPHRNLLHADELAVACNLRLTCAQYLASKRRIFIRRLESLRNGKEFRRTDAQQACKIDVNKASQLWVAFDKVGWFDKTWVERYI
ncbi:Uu.00g110220.m01.CDS01 [Anthostomella pinea]|uniref:Uu.00g110220.m01.CDS01 n=1 Tax=Anthostomella pinea TaxID=933095 RepID=A0AAI8YG86_9PEZI|nr:Uu.00g110220.m01.CDS01 [Anthostomella pinea]